MLRLFSKFTHLADILVGMSLHFLNKSYELGALRLPSSLVMAPMTRRVATQEHIPTSEMARYYRARAKVGLIISEATAISASANGYFQTPGLYNAAQVAGWKRVTDEVHREGGGIFAQIWHAGMFGHSEFRSGDRPIAPSPLSPLRPSLPGSNLVYEGARAMVEGDFSQVLADFVQATILAKEAGFDGVEIHGSGGYLLDAFLHYASNQRADAYGGSPEEMVRFPLEVVDSLLKLSFPVGIRLSPIPLPGMQAFSADERDKLVFITLFQELSRRSLAYLHLATDIDPRLSSLSHNPPFRICS